MSLPRPQLAVCTLLIFLIAAGLGQAEPVAVRYHEGENHGFLELQTLEGKNIAYGEIVQTVRGPVVTSRLVFRFLDGSLYDDTTRFSQDRTFRLIHDHLIERGPSFKQPMETTINASTGEVTVRYMDKDGKQKTENEHLQLPDDIANGLLFTILKDIRPETPETTASMVATSPKPRIVKIRITPQGKESLSVGTIHRQAMHYVLKVDIGGIAGVVAPIIGKQPPDTHAWVIVDSAPAVVRNEGPLYADGPIWRMQSAHAPLISDRPNASESKKRLRISNRK